MQECIVNIESSVVEDSDVKRKKKKRKNEHETKNLEVDTMKCGNGSKDSDQVCSQEDNSIQSRVVENHLIKSKKKKRKKTFETEMLDNEIIDMNNQGDSDAINVTKKKKKHRKRDETEREHFQTINET